MLKTLLYETLSKNGGKMVPFAGWLMPLNFNGISTLESVLHTRRHASLFDVSHILDGDGADVLVESLMPVDTKSMQINSAQYTVLLNERGGIIDDAILTKTETGFTLISNASRAKVVSKLLKGSEEGTNTALLALQGLLSTEKLKFMTSIKTSKGLTITRCGYTGEDGFEISIPSGDAANVLELIIKDDRVRLGGLAARDILRLEAGFCLYGHDIDEHTTPIEAGLKWVVSKSRLEGGKNPFPGLARIREQIQNGVVRRRAGFISEEGPPSREGTEIIDLENGSPVGKITSGTFSPHLGCNISMGYLNSSTPENLKSLISATNLGAMIRGRAYPIKTTNLPFVPFKNYKNV